MLQLTTNLYTYYLPATISYLYEDIFISVYFFSQLSKSEFIVKSFSTEGVEYHCNVQLGRCSCYVGWRGCPCKHLGAVAEFYPDSTADNYQPTLSQQDMVSFYNCLMGMQVCCQ